MNEITEFIRTRRSVVIRNLNNTPLPQADLDLIIECGLRVPDHAMLVPWRLCVVLPEQGGHLGQTVLMPEFKRLNPEATEAMLTFEAARFTRTGAIIAVLSCPAGPSQNSALGNAVICRGCLRESADLSSCSRLWRAMGDRMVCL